MFYRFKNMEENMHMMKTHMEGIFLKTKMKLLVIKTKMSQIKYIDETNSKQIRDTMKEKKNQGT